MKETELLGKLMPGHPDLLPIIENIRGKHQIPEVRPEDDDITQVLLTMRLIGKQWEKVN